MSTTLRQAKEQARHHRKQGDFARSLQIYQQILSTVPLANDIRLLVADVLAEAGADDAAAQVYQSVAVHFIRSGHPLPTLVACQGLAKLGKPIDAIECR